MINSEIRPVATLFEYYREKESLAPAQFSLDFLVNTSGHARIDERIDGSETIREGNLTRKQMHDLTLAIQQWRAASYATPGGKNRPNVTIAAAGKVIRYADLKPREFVGYMSVALPSKLSQLVSEMDSIVGAIPAKGRN